MTIVLSRFRLWERLLLLTTGQIIKQLFRTRKIIKTKLIVLPLLKKECLRRKTES